MGTLSTFKVVRRVQRQAAATDLALSIQEGGHKNLSSPEVHNRVAAMPEQKRSFKIDPQCEFCLTTK